MDRCGTNKVEDKTEMVQYPKLFEQQRTKRKLSFKFPET